MNRKFILVDHSIRDSTGHYLEYAKRVLCAAKSCGFRTILGVNSRAGDITCPDADAIERVFSRTFWENQKMRRTAVICSYLQKSSRAVGNPHFSRTYARELQELFSRVGAKTGDIVFIPSLGGVELIGIALYTATRNPVDLDWHLVFRRDLPEPGSGFVSKAHIERFRIIRSFPEFDKRFAHGRVAFYTDTEELAARYSRGAGRVFTTLPIPLDDTMSIKNRNRGAPLIVSYMGDAREEKGIHLLPSLINDIRSRGVGEADVKFRIQANFPLTGISARAIHAKNTLLGLQGDGLQLVEGPFDSGAYNQLISSSDIILIPYCRKSYQARSSGIFVEALAAGVPTIYPQGSWMEKTEKQCGSVAYVDTSDMRVALMEIITHYPEHEEQSIAFSTRWRQRHSARNLLDVLSKNKQMSYGRHPRKT